MARLCVASKEVCKFLSLKPKNANQAQYVELLKAKRPEVVVGVGPAGCGKTLLSTHIGVQKLQSNEVQKIVLTRPMVCVDEELGIMPGGLLEKVAPWMLPFQDVLLTHYPKNTLEKLIRDNTIEICPLSIMRGRSFDNAWIICDEAQNTTPSQMMMLLTRLGKNSKVVITGDPEQHDRGFDNNGLTDLLNRCGRYEMNVGVDETPSWFKVVAFQDEDVERNPVIKKILKIYKY